MLKHIILAVTRLGNYQALPPFQDTIVFDDDFQLEGDICCGSFNFNLKDYLRFDGEGEYFVNFSLGSVISNTERMLL